MRVDSTCDSVPWAMGWKIKKNGAGQSLPLLLHPVVCSFGPRAAGWICAKSLSFVFIGEMSHKHLCVEASVITQVEWRHVNCTVDEAEVGAKRQYILHYPMPDTVTALGRTFSERLLRNLLLRAIFIYELAIFQFTTLLFPIWNNSSCVVYI